MAKVPNIVDRPARPRLRETEPVSLAEAVARLAQARDRRHPWLSPAGIEAARDVPEVMGPVTDGKPQ